VLLLLLGFLMFRGAAPAKGARPPEPSKRGE
jgi:hypothetical protein